SHIINVYMFFPFIFEIFLYMLYFKEIKNVSSLGENVKPISIHRSKHKKPISDKEFGEYTSGLIEGDGHMHPKGMNMTMAFNNLDISLAYYMKKRMGAGVVRVVKDKNALVYISNKQGAITIAKLINGNIRTLDKLESFNKTLERINLELDNPMMSQKTRLSEITNSYWLTGFTDADGSFQMKTIDRKDRNLQEVRLNFQMDQKKKYILEKIQEELGGNMGYRNKQDTYYYGSTSFGNARKIIKYFDKYPLLSTKYTNFIYWRKVYMLIYNKKHLTVKGILLIEKIKSKTNSYLNKMLNME
uniref:LAGLIDADG endonuclease n=1 Tax=Saccharomycopsis fibuligera TaxID=4944 RepID=UPI002A8299D3